MPSLAVLHQTLTGQLRRVRQQVAGVAVPGYNHSVDETVGAPGRQEGSTPTPASFLRSLTQVLLRCAEWGAQNWPSSEPLTSQPCKGLTGSEARPVPRFGRGHCSPLRPDPFLLLGPGPLSLTPSLIPGSGPHHPAQDIPESGKPGLHWPGEKRRGSRSISSPRRQ